MYTSKEELELIAKIRKLVSELSDVNENAIQELEEILEEKIEYIMEV